jgi:hypothetical protein
MPTAAGDFRLFCDNAYGVHHLTDRPIEIANILELIRIGRWCSPQPPR